MAIFDSLSIKNGWKINQTAFLFWRLFSPISPFCYYCQPRIDRVFVFQIKINTNLLQTIVIGILNVGRRFDLVSCLSLRAGGFFKGFSSRLGTSYVSRVCPPLATLLRLPADLWISASWIPNNLRPPLLFCRSFVCVPLACVFSFCFSCFFVVVSLWEFSRLVRRTLDDAEIKILHVKELESSRELLDRCRHHHRRL